MKTVIYKFKTLKVVRVVEEEVCITSLKDDEDMMPAEIWNLSSSVEKV
jgi:hypothetical protein